MRRTGNEPKNYKFFIHHNWEDSLLYFVDLNSLTMRLRLNSGHCGKDRISERFLGLQCFTEGKRRLPNGLLNGLCEGARVKFSCTRWREGICESVSWGQEWRRMNCKFWTHKRGERKGTLRAELTGVPWAELKSNWMGWMHTWDGKACRGKQSKRGKR